MAGMANMTGRPLKFPSLLSNLVRERRSAGLVSVALAPYNRSVRCGSLSTIFFRGFGRGRKKNLVRACLVAGPDVCFDPSS